MKSTLSKYVSSGVKVVINAIIFYAKVHKKSDLMRDTYVTDIPPPPLTPLSSPEPVGLKLTVWSSAVKAHSTLTVLSVSCIITGFSWITTWFT